MDKVTTGAWSLALSIWNVTLVVSVASLAGLGRLATIAAVLDISDNTQFFDHFKLSMSNHS